MANEWMQQAACADMDANIFFPSDHDPLIRNAEMVLAKKTCMGCDVREECFSYSMKHEEGGGIWAGLTEAERARHRIVWSRKM